MQAGTVKWFNETRGFGFIQPDDGGKDIFFHISALDRAGLDTPPEGTRLLFEIAQGRNGKIAAENLRLES